MEVTLPSDTEILMTRTFDAPRAIVWEALTKPEHVRNWYGFRDSTMLVCEMDLTVGGKWRYVTTDRNGGEVEFYGVYKEIVAPERLVNTEFYAPYPNDGSVVTTVLTEKDGVTLYASTARYGSKEVRDMVISSGMETGAAVSLDRLAEVADALK